jgi:hypothetical protein
MRERVRKEQARERNRQNNTTREYGDYCDWTGRMDLEDR